MSRMIFTVAAVFVSLQLGPTSAMAQYYTSAPWCAVISLGAGDVHWSAFTVYRPMSDDHPCRQSRILQSDFAGAADPRRTRRARPY